MKKTLVIAIVIIVGGCNPILKTSFWGIRLSKSYTPEQIISSIGTEGDFIDIKDNDIQYENLQYQGILWDEARFCLSKEGVLEGVGFSKYFNSKKECRDKLYSLKKQFDERYGLPDYVEIKGEQESRLSPTPKERFLYYDSRNRAKGGSLTLEAEYLKDAPYVLYKLSISFNENKALQKWIESQF